MSLYSRLRYAITSRCELRNRGLVPVQNALHAIALGHGVRRGHTLWSREGLTVLTTVSFPPHASYRRDELLALCRHLDEQIQTLHERVQHQAKARARASLLMTHPGVGTGDGVGHGRVPGGSIAIRRRESAGRVTWA